MADRASGEDNPGVPKEVFELDKDERWQARLDEARARREIALREKAAGKPQKPRPKPWEVDGATVDEPPAIDPIIQERGDDKFDFADRLETIRDAKTDSTPVAPIPPAADAGKPRTSSQGPVAREASKAPEPRARPQPSLIMPGAPDVAELAARYAATLDTTDPLEIGLPEERVKKKHTPKAELVPLPGMAQPQTDSQAASAPRTRADRRRGIRPLGMALGLLGLAVLPFGTEAPPLETGPAMPKVDVLGMQPALGVTWSLYQRPVQTRSGEWVPRPAPQPLDTVSVSSALRPLDTVALPPLPPVERTSSPTWVGVAPVPSGDAPALSAPEVVGPDDLPTSAAASAQPTPPVASDDDTGMPALDRDVPAPPRPATLVDEEEVLPAAPPEPPAPRPSNDSVVEANPLRVTILAPARVDRALTEDIASSVQNDGHELVRVRDVGYNISERNVRYFHEADRDSAARMAERYDAELRDFTWFRPKPLDGTAELWLAGRAPGGNTSGRVPPAASGGQAAGRSDFLGRVFDRLGLGTELPEVLPDELRSVLPDGR